MRYIDIKTWKRKAHYECFSNYTNPAFSMSVRMDVTQLVRRCKAVGTSFFTDFLYIVTRCLNQIEEFRIRIKNGRVVVCDRIHPSYIVMTDDNVIVTCRSEAGEDYREFYRTVREDIARAKTSGDRERFDSSDDMGVFFVSCLPWLDFVTMSNPYDFADADRSSIPRITWGKYVEQGGRFYLTLDIAAHHALMDGEPMARGFLAVQDALLAPEKLIK